MAKKAKGMKEPKTSLKDKKTRKNLEKTGRKENEKAKIQNRLIAYLLFSFLRKALVTYMVKGLYYST